MSNNLHEAFRQWSSRPQDQRYQSLDALILALKTRAMQSRQVDIKLSEISAEAVDNDGLVITHGEKQAVPTHWSFGQFTSWIHAPAGYLRELPAELAVKNINHGIQRYASEQGSLKFLTITGEQSKTLRAVTSTTYGRVWDFDVAVACQDMVQRTGNKFYNPKAYDPHSGEVVPSGLYASDRDVFIFMIDGGSVFDVGERAKLSRGFFLSNSETGARVLKLTTFLFNYVCGNHIVWGAEDIRELKIKHSSGAPARFLSEVQPALLEYANAAGTLLETTVNKAQSYLLPKEDEKLLEFLTEHKFTRSEARESIDTAKREEGECRTLWQAVQGATAYARGFAFVDARIELETKAGNLLNLVK